MLHTTSLANKSMLQSALAGKSVINPKGQRARRLTFASLMLTSLVDAFSILVIFLIMNHSSSIDVVNVGDKIKLPEAKESQFINAGVVVRVENGRFFVEDRPTGMDRLAAELKRHNTGAESAKKDGLIIVADRNLDYADLSPVILAGSNAGFTKYKFAVLRKD